MTSLLKQACRGLLLFLLCAPALAAPLTDLAGRKVEVPAQVKRVLLGEGRMIYSLSLLEGADPFARVAGWQGDFRGLDVQGYAAYRARFPQADQVPLVGGTSADTFSVEKALAVHPDLVLLALSGGHGPGPGSEALRQLEAAGVAVLFVDFSEHPLLNTVPSMRLLGEALGRQQRAAEFIDFYQQAIEAVREPLAGAEARGELERPRLFVDMLAGLQDCCGSPGRGNFGELIELAGGQNIGAGRIPGAIGTLNPEYILASDPQQYVATGVFGAGRGGVTLGYTATPQQARDSLAQIARRAPLNELRAVREGHVHAMWHIFYDSPEHLVAVQALAKWLHPELFADLDPERTRAELYRRFMPIPASGVFTVSLQP
ncbi:iron complex transport system substrate-binding protein [Pseudomonas citronellolis]|uniref:Iron complex transport system substrate-binding protein n=1 Tax=Pseudomonas citronellolis TaxID=53408 RepID=A0AAQ1KF10_9PSED|nr:MULTISPECIES: ABC transporter substrate-binding protein [Pseudomonas]MCL6687238.1 ABC transporter substrate-binding protein [Pseudomonas sp. R3.Fl]MCP1603248.1 iron complex transport system substrate-binding protein [Pseudomonas citronellolis]MCP1643215.1 iron complex transport system substrate-binding protein [Pseudomonas citronellolis]MCP1654757.1 iron complex transport system substrate-binding protein [Pseudomonas citronellolis]MCP1666141.1 iron complex transport system substrate-binding